MRILHIVSFYEQDISKGGVARAAGLLARAQARIGADVTVFTTDSDDERSGVTAQREDCEGVGVHFFRVSRRSRLFFSRSLMKACLRRIKEFDVVHVHGLWNFPGTWGALAARWDHVPYVVSPQGMLNKWAIRFRAYKKVPYWYAMERHTIGGAAWIHFVTDEERRQSRTWVEGKKTRVIPIGLDLQGLTVVPPRGEFRDRLQIPRGVPLLTFLGRIHPVKGLDVLLRALVKIKAEEPEVILAIAGPDEDGHTDRLQGLAIDLGVEGHVRWLGTIEEQAKLGFLLDADLFVLPSFSENFGLAAVEAMAVGCPVVLGRGVNIAPQVEGYGAGLVVSTEPEALATAIIGALQDHETRQTMGKAGRRLVAEWYDGEAAAREMLKGYEECLR